LFVAMDVIRRYLRAADDGDFPDVLVVEGSDLLTRLDASTDRPPPLTPGSEAS